MINKWILYYIRKAKRNQIDEILTNARKRKEELFPGWEIIYLALPKENRKKGSNTWKEFWIWSAQPKMYRILFHRYQNIDSTE